MSSRDVSKDVKFFNMNWMNSIPFLLLAIFPTLTVLAVLCAITFVLMILEKRNMSLIMAIRRVRTFFIGRKREIKPSWIKNTRIN